MDVSKLKDKDREIAELIGIENYERLIEWRHKHLYSRFVYNQTRRAFGNAEKAV